MEYQEIAMEELRIIILSLLGLAFIVMNYRRREGNIRKWVDNAWTTRDRKHTSGGKGDNKEEN